MNADKFLTENNWVKNHETSVSGRAKEVMPIDDLSVSAATAKFLRSEYPGVYRHQRSAVEAFLNGRDICLTTGTASGKSLVFHIAALEVLQQQAASKILVSYPLKALGREQEDRWQEALTGAGLGIKVGRIDGQVPTASRLDILKRSRVLIMTPDIIHAWLLSNLSNKTVLQFLQSTRLIIVDEVHNYSGVFGSNAALLFRRLRHLMDLLGASPKFVCASATISEPARHLEKLFGIQFDLIGPELDTSPRFETTVKLVTPPRAADLLSEVSHILQYFASETDSRFLAFVDSRKQAEQISSIVARNIQKDKEDDDKFASFEDLERLEVLPFRAGYEERDRNLIQDRLRTGSLRGVVSTSALELGIDIPYLDTAVLVGVPSSLTSLYQRIGRIGRHKPGEVVIINTGSVYDEAIFREPASLFNRPLAEGALYLENLRLQYIHALCLARQEGEHDQVAAFIGDQGFTSNIAWPDGFMELCRKERTGEVPIDLQAMKAESGDDPNHVFPLRDVESQYKVELRQGPEQQRMGSLSGAQLMREAYPGAVYYYATQPFRVYKIIQPSKTVLVRREKRYTTKPQMPPTLVFPNLSAGNVHSSAKYGDLLVLECNLQVRETVNGFKERRGGNEFPVTYPIDPVETGIHFPLPRFTRNFFTTGVILSHPSLANPKVKYDALAQLLYEAFVMTVPFERQDINFAADKHRVARPPIVEGSPFIVIYDQTYGSLHLSGRLGQDADLRLVLEACGDLVKNEESLSESVETATALNSILACLKKQREPLLLGGESADVIIGTVTRVRVIMPGSRGIGVRRNNEEFAVERVLFHPTVNGLAYRGRFQSTTVETVAEFVPIADLVEIPGESRMGYYDYDLGELIPDEGGPKTQAAASA
jgi:DEAD/DEAH box helicase domain-containing protein